MGRRAARGMARRLRWPLPPRLAVAAYRDLPDALERVSATARPALLGAWHAAAVHGGAPAELVELTPLLGALLASVPAPARAGAVAALDERRRRRFPPASPACCAACPGSSTRHRRSASASGSRTGSRSPPGIAPRPSPTSASRRAPASGCWPRRPPPSTLDDMQGELRRLVHMLSGAPATPRPLGTVPPAAAARGDGGRQHGGAAAVDRRVSTPARTTPVSIASRPRCSRAGGSTAPTPSFPTAPAPCARPDARRRSSISSCSPTACASRRACPPRTPVSPASCAGPARRWSARTRTRPTCSTRSSRWRCGQRRRARRPAAGSPRSRSSCCRACARCEDPGATAADALRVAERLAVLFPDADRAAMTDSACCPTWSRVLLDAGAGRRACRAAPRTPSRRPPSRPTERRRAARRPARRAHAPRRRAARRRRRRRLLARPRGAPAADRGPRRGRPRPGSRRPRRRRPVST